MLANVPLLHVVLHSCSQGVQSIWLAKGMLAVINLSNAMPHKVANIDGIEACH